VNAEEALEIEKQNRFGLQVIAAALLFTAVMLFILSCSDNRWKAGDGGCRGGGARVGADTV
jgi:hypothetical protein